MNRKNQIIAFLEKSPNDPFLNYALAMELISENNDTEASEILLKLLDFQPEYIPTYYHYGKLLERQSRKSDAIEIYKKGISVAQKANDNHARSELQSALLELEYE